MSAPDRSLPWAKLRVDLGQHPQVRPGGFPAYAVIVHALQVHARLGGSGHVPTAYMVPGYVSDQLGKGCTDAFARKGLDALVSLGALTEVDGGYEILAELYQGPMTEAERKARNRREKKVESGHCPTVSDDVRRSPDKSDNVTLEERRGEERREEQQIPPVGPPVGGGSPPARPAPPAGSTSDPDDPPQAAAPPDPPPKPTRRPKPEPPPYAVELAERLVANVLTDVAPGAPHPWHADRPRTEATRRWAEWARLAHDVDGNPIEALGALVDGWTSLPDARRAFHESNPLKGGSPSSGLRGDLAGLLTQLRGRAGANGASGKPKLPARVASEEDFAKWKESDERRRLAAGGAT